MIITSSRDILVKFSRKKACVKNMMILHVCILTALTPPKRPLFDADCPTNTPYKGSAAPFSFWRRMPWPQIQTLFAKQTGIFHLIIFLGQRVDARNN